jgi:hypothetical protein
VAATPVRWAKAQPNSACSAIVGSYENLQFVRPDVPHLPRPIELDVAWQPLRALGVALQDPNPIGREIRPRLDGARTRKLLLRSAGRPACVPPMAPSHRYLRRQGDGGLTGAGRRWWGVSRGLAHCEVDNRRLVERLAEATTAAPRRSAGQRGSWGGTASSGWSH